MVALVVVWREECEFSHALLCPLTHLHVVLLLRFIQSALIVHYSDITLISLRINWSPAIHLDSLSKESPPFRILGKNKEFVPTCRTGRLGTTKPKEG